MSSLMKIYRAIFWPDGLWHWLPFALYAVLTRRNNRYDLVVGYSPSFAGIIAARFYMLFNKKARLVLDFGDPFSVSEEMPVNNYNLYKRLNYFSEYWAFKAASMTTFTNEKTLSLYRNKYPSISTFEMLPHLVSIDLFYKKHVVDLSATLTFGYVGALHKGIREPQQAISVLEKLSGKLQEISVVFYGPLNGLDFFESKHVRYMGAVSRGVAIELLQGFDFIINIENENCPMVPSKINELMALGKPIINFLSRINVSSFKDYPIVFNVSVDTNINEIVLFINEMKQKQLRKSEVEILLKGKTVNCIAEQYLTY